MSPHARHTETSDFRADIQGLRALAVGLVVVFHLWPHRLSGGYVGVDVFFVISGYLITAHLYREVETTGRLGLARFWARRIRRLLPASFLVLLVSTGLVLAYLPSTLWAASARQIGASALYVENWVLVRDSVTYLAQGEIPTVAEHYWSLSVEEQFYVLWPLLVVGLLLTRHTVRRRSLIALLSVVSAGSLIYSVIATNDNHAVAYFSTPARVWEFGAGALLALAVTRIPRLSPALAAAAGWLGFVGIVGSAFRLDSASAFPGWVALFSVLGATLMIASGESTAAWSVSRILSWRPVTFIGDISYSVYLWHWPLIVVLPFVTLHPLTTANKIEILAATVLLAWLSKVLVEDGLRTAPLLAATPWRSIAFAALGMTVVVGGGVAVNTEVNHRAAASTAATRNALAGVGIDTCIGPGALTPENHCPKAVGTGRLIPGLEAVFKEHETGPYFTCTSELADNTIIPCPLGNTTNPERSVAVVGDSHAAMWLPAFDQVGKDRNWAVTGFVKSSCPMTAATRVLTVETTKDSQRSCRTWTDSVVRAIIADKAISVVFTTAYSSAYEWAAPEGARMADPATTGFATIWKRLQDAGKTVVVLRDVPRPGDNPLTCLAQRKRAQCINPLAQALVPDAAADAARNTHGVPVIDLRDRFCDDQRCYSVVGDVIAYMDHSHISGTYARTLAPYLERQIDRLPLP